ncbi:Hypothetical protein FKW44_016391 [Caligus rogercresseyi]|uniref:Uncharacterized protein n=1 Tax=Caligus rogercresseyi TaxID=217165 RepID=A0A7T8K0E5_CALRO|nr:Hypothetical protein FKW44_016391 [Caligus rogercresseyi]
MQVHRLVDLHALLDMIIGALFPSNVIPAQTMTEGGFCLLKRVLSCTGILPFSI